MRVKRYELRGVTKPLLRGPHRRIRRFQELMKIGSLLMLLIAVEGRAQSTEAGFNPGANNAVYALAVQGDGKLLVGGFFTMLGGAVPGTTARNHIGRLNSNGTLDASFDPGANNTVYALAVQADGKILVGGDFTTLGGGGIGTITRN